MTEQNSETQARHRDNEITEAWGDGRVEEFLHVTAGEPEAEAVEVDDVVGHIDRDRVHADPHERLTPFLPFPHIHHQIKEPEQQRAVAAGHQDVGGGPDFFNDRELKPPKVSQQHTHQSGQEEVIRFPTRLNPVALEQESGQNAQQTGRHGGQRAQKALRIPGAVIILAREVFLVEIVGEVDALDEHAGNDVGARQIQLSDVGETGLLLDGLQAPGRWAHVREWHKGHQRPVTNQQGGANRENALEPKETENQPGEQIAKGNAIEHAQEADVRPVAAEAAGVNDGERKQQHAAPEYTPQGGGFADRFDALAQRKNQGYPHDKHEERKDQIVESEPFPVFMGQLFRERADDSPVAHFVQRVEEFLRADDPKHVETAKRIQRHQTRRGGRKHGGGG